MEVKRTADIAELEVSRCSGDRERIRELRGRERKQQEPDTEHQEPEGKTRPYALWLSGTGIRRGTIQKLRETFLELTGQDPRQFAEEIFYMPETELREICRESFPEKAEKQDDIAESLLRERHRDPIREERELSASGIWFLDRDASAYPDRLRRMPDSPYGIYGKGALPDDAAPSVAVVGARMASAYGRDMAMKFGTELAENGIQIISGMARGVDGISQRAAVGAGGRSFAVLGCGVDICYPAENRELYDALPGRGGILSEYAPGTVPMAGLFPPRNRIIAALSDLVLLVEARERSGSLITADFALEQGKDLYAVPGRITDPLAVGCNRLIRQGAGIATCPEDVIEAVTGVRRSAEDETFAPDYLKKISLQEPERSLYEALEERDLCDLSFLIRSAETRLHCQIRTQDAIRYMMDLVIKGLAEEAAAGVYQKRFR